eukprot:29245-Eustigmatos_ZCMA.PRE.1
MDYKKQDSIGRKHSPEYVVRRRHSIEAFHVSSQSEDSVIHQACVHTNGWGCRSADIFVDTHARFVGLA